MKAFSLNDWPAGEADLRARVAAFQQARRNHATTAGVPAPREEPLVEELAAFAGEWKLQAPPEDLPPAPGPAHEFVGGGWVLNPAKAEALRVAGVKNRLAEIDRTSVRAIREYIAARADAPQLLKDREAAAVAERKKLL